LEEVDSETDDVHCVIVAGVCMGRDVEFVVFCLLQFGLMLY
jgi:hypothetical protein